MNRNMFIVNTTRLVNCAHNASIVADAFGCDIDCEGFIGDLIYTCGDLILQAITNESSEKYEEIVESFWNDIVNKNASLQKIESFYDERIGK